MLPGAKNAYEILGAAIRKSGQQNAIYDTEDRSRGTNAEGKNREHRKREARPFAERPNSKADVPKRAFEPLSSPHIATFLFDLFNAAELQTGAPAGFRLAHAGAKVFGHQTIEVEAQLGIQMPLHLVAFQQPPPPVHPFASLDSKIKRTAFARC